jgi:hypothetical protein
MKKTTPELQIQKLGPWFHNLHFSCGLQTAPEHPLGDFPSFKWQQISSYLPADLTGGICLSYRTACLARSLAWSELSDPEAEVETEFKKGLWMRPETYNLAALNNLSD